MFGGADSTGRLNDTWEYGISNPTLSANPSSISIAAGGTQNLTLNAGAAHANRGYWIFSSITGTTPGVNLLGVHIPLVADPFTSIAIGLVNTAPFTNFRSTLSATGTATASLNIPANQPVSTGLKIYNAYVVYDPATGRLYASSNPVSVELK